MRATTKMPFTPCSRRLALVLATAAVLFLTSSIAAEADTSFCTIGSGAGQCEEPRGVAVAPSTGHVYVADRDNNRIDVFDSTGSFLFAFGWGVADGTSAQLQTCAATCFKGLEGGGAGEFLKPASIAVDPAAPNDVYVFEQSRVQKFSPSGEFIAAWGGGVISGGASGKGDLVSGSSTVSNVVTTKKTFAAGQAISGPGIPVATRIAIVGPGTITLSKTATASGTGVALTAPEGAGNEAVNEVQVLESLSKVVWGISFSTPDPSPTLDSVKTPLPIPTNAPASGPGSVQEMLEGLSNIDPGDLAVTGPNGGPYTIEFTGRYADTDVDSLRVLDSQGTPERTLTSTTQNGAGSAGICTIASDCAAGVAGGGAGQFNAPKEETRPIAVEPGGNIYVGDSLQTGHESGGAIYSSRVEKFAPSGTFAEEFALPGTERISALAVDSGGNPYVARGSLRVEKYDPSGAPLNTISLNNVRAIAVNASDHLFASHLEGQSNQTKVITEFDPAGATLRRFGYGLIEDNLAALAVNSTAAGDLFGSEPVNDRVRYLSFPAAGPLPCCVQALPGNTKATLKGGVNPEGEAATYHFEYLTEADFKANGNSFTGSKPAASTPESAAVGSDFTLHGIEAQIGCANPSNPPQASCLKPATDYRYRLVAKNGDGENSFEGQFETKPPFEITETYATDVGTDAARIHATVNPLGIPTTAYFEYVDNAAYQADLDGGGDGFAAASKVPDIDGGATPIDLGSGEAPKAALAQLSSLPPGTTYHYRVVVSDPFVSEAGPARTFAVFPLPKPPVNSCPNAAFRGGPSANLPECRAYEMVSPVDKNGGDIKVLGITGGFPSRLDQSSDDGDRFAYSSVAAFADPLSSPYTSQYLATRIAGQGWSTRAISPPRESKSLFAGTEAKFDVQYKAFATDLSSGWLIHDTNPTLEPCAQEGFVNLYRRDNASGGYEALTTAKPLNQVATLYIPELQGLSADGSHAIFRASAKLTPDASSTKQLVQLYEHIAGEGCGELRLVSVLPNGSASKVQSTAGTVNAGVVGESRVNTVSRAVSADGSRIFWTALDSNNLLGGALYVRIEGKETVQIAAGPAHFLSAAADGSTALYEEGKKLYEAKIPPGSSTSTLIAAGFKGLAGASADASRVYFVSTEALGGEGEAGEPNLYLHQAGGATSLVATLYPGNATLPGGDLNGGFETSGFAVAQPEPIKNGVRITPDGTHLAFVSAGSPTGYENTDVVDGRPDLELYLYDMETGKVACVSCNPTGGRPEGRKFQQGEQGEAILRVSAQMPPAENQSFAPRVLSEDGNRLFFESFEALLPDDTNGKADVYQWQRASGQQACDEAGAELFVPASGGCLSLISTGQTPADSEIADVSPDGSDVFIRTASSLLPQDPGQVDIYDARVKGGMPQPPPQPAACEGEACQGPLTAPNDLTPASATFNGPGNVVAVCKTGQVNKKHRCVSKPRCAKGKARRKGRCVKPKKHATKNHKQTNHSRRVGR
ncbi:MAG: hypothetical protein WA862_10845 [Solirubrobacterales bacterium]